MTRQDYFEALVGQFLEVAGTTARNQCVDSVNFYIKYVLRLPPIEWTNAVDFPEKADRGHYDWIENTATNKPTEGDIIVWKGAVGHIAVIFDNNATTTKFWSFDQNWPTYSSCRVVEHPYTNVRGWLHPKVIQSDVQSQLDQCRLDRDRNWNWFTGLCDALKVPQIFEVAKAEIDKLVTLEDVIRDKDQTITLKEQEIIRMKEELSTIQSQLVKASTANTEAQTAIVELKQVVDEYKTRAEDEEKVIKQLGDRIEELKKVNPIESYNGIDLIIIGIRRIFGK